MTVFPLDEVKAAWKSGEVTASEIGRRTQRTPQTVSRALNGEIDPPDSTVREYYNALQAIRTERQSDPSIGQDVDDERALSAGKRVA